tara:strand:+ start:263 stop:1015 length:753 start_codon:yes stop_codon:yes gene_type:complete
VHIKRDLKTIEVDLSDNHLLATLAEDDRKYIRPRVQLVHHEQGDVLYEPGDDVVDAYFPCGTSVVTFQVLMSEGSAIETGLIGSEGAVGGIVSHGRLPAYCRATVLTGGSFYRIGLLDLELGMQQSVRLRYLMARYADCLLAQIFQSVACNAVHTIEQRTAKWLLATLNRTERDDVVMTQDQLGSLLGVGRSYITRVLSRMRKDGLIDTRRRNIEIQDRDALRGRACDCDHLVALHFDAVMKGVYTELVC